MTRSTSEPRGHPDQLVQNAFGFGGTVDTSEFLADVPVGRMEDAH